MGNFIKLVYATLKSEGVDINDLDSDEAVKKYKELQKSSGGKEGELEGTPAEQKRVREINKNSFDREHKIEELKKSLENTQGFFNRCKIKNQIFALEEGFDSVEEYNKSKEEKKQRAIKEDEIKKIDAQKKKEGETKIKKEKLEKEIREAPENKRKQFEIIQNSNPMLDDYHVGIRSPNDIKTFSEVIDDKDSFCWGDFSREEARLALKTNSITVFSSYPIKQGTFISTSRLQAEEYAGGNGKKIYSKIIPLEKVAWISGDEGQFADINQ